MALPMKPYPKDYVRMGSARPPTAGELLRAGVRRVRGQTPLQRLRRAVVRWRGWEWVRCMRSFLT